MTAKGYWIGNNIIYDMDELYRYRNANRETMTKYGAKFLTMQGRQTVTEGTFLPNFTIVEFPSYEAALACYQDPTYVEAHKIRLAVTEGNSAIVEGYDGPQDF